jgi:hypothetical protein
MSIYEQSWRSLETNTADSMRLLSSSLFERFAILPYDDDEIEQDGEEYRAVLPIDYSEYSPITVPLTKFSVMKIKVPEDIELDEEAELFNVCQIKYVLPKPHLAHTIRLYTVESDEPFVNYSGSYYVGDKKDSPHPLMENRAAEIDQDLARLCRDTGSFTLF